MTLIAWAAWLAGVLGFGLLVTGIALIHIPAALITGGLCLLFWAYLADKAGAALRNRQSPGGG